VPIELDIEAHRPVAERRAAQWRTIAESLRADATGQDLARTLLGYVADGGVSEMRRLLDQHVRDNGLSLRVLKAQRRLDELDELTAQLLNGLSASRQESSEDPASPSVQAPRLLRDLRRRRDRLAEQTSQLRDPDQVWLAPRWSVRQDVMRKAADLVMSWPEWEAIFSCVEDAVVVPTTGTAMNLLELELELELEEANLAGANRLPQRLGDFQEAFRGTCDEVRAYARDQALAGTRRWLDERSADSRDLQRRATDLLDAEARARFASSDALKRLPTAIERILSPGSVAGGLTNIVDQADPKLPDGQPFPLRAEQLTSWAEGLPPDHGARHFVRVVRLRSALIDSVTDYALSCLDAVQDLLATQLHGLYDKGPTTRLPDERQFVAAVLGEHAGSPDVLPDPIAALTALRRPDKDSIFGG